MPEISVIQAEVRTKLHDSKPPFRKTIFIIWRIRENEEVEGDGLSDSRAVKLLTVEGKGFEKRMIRL